MGVFAVLAGAAEKRQGAALITVLEGGKNLYPGQKMIIDGGDLVAGELPALDEAAAAELQVKAASAAQQGSCGLLQLPGTPVKFFLQPLPPSPRLIILGGGHVGAALSRMAAGLDYEIIVIDDRPTFASRQQHPFAHRLICEDFSRALELLEQSPADYFVIVTRGHRHDRICLEKTVGRNKAYSGMIGSRRRVRSLLQELAAAGYDEEALAKVYTPIGLQIGAVTEGEIALSILAQITQVRRGAGCMEQTVQPEVLVELVGLEQKGGEAVLATVVKTLGSTPRKAGTWMLIYPDGRLTGTVGGGCAEADVRREALNLFAQPVGCRTPKLYQVEMTAEAAAKEGMACGGRMELFLDPLHFTAQAPLAENSECPG